MKKILYILLSILVLATGCSKNEEVIKVERSYVEKENIIEEAYVDDSNITLGFYLRDKSTSTYNYIDKEIYLPWNQYVDIAVFKVLATNESKISGYYMQDLFPKYWNKIEEKEKYKLGYNLKYTNNEGTFSYNIINPSDRLYYVFHTVQLYVYDDVTPSKGSWYDHLDDNEVTEGVLATSIKLCASTYIDNVIGPMTLTVFAYKDSNDFDPETHEYRGNSSYSIKIYRSN